MLHRRQNTSFRRDGSLVLSLNPSASSSTFNFQLPTSSLQLPSILSATSISWPVRLPSNLLIQPSIKVYPCVDALALGFRGIFQPPTSTVHPSNMEAVAAPPPPFDPTTFNPWYQNVTMYAPDGSIVTVNMEMVDYYRLYSSRLGISFGSQIGSSFMLLLVLVLLTRSDKRKSMVFILNALCLFINTIRVIFSACYLTGNLMHPYGLLTGLFRATTTDLAISITSNTLSFVVLALVMASLSLQVWVACVTTGTLQRVLIMGITTAMALVCIGFKFAFMVATHIATVQVVDRGVDRLSAYSWITQAVAILMYSFVFTWKLGYAMVQRRRLNMLQFGPMQIVFIMGCQTMIIPGMHPHSQITPSLTSSSRLLCSSVLSTYPGQGTRDWQHGAHRHMHIPSTISNLGRCRQRFCCRLPRP